MLRKNLEVVGGFFILLVGLVLSLPLVPGPGIPIMILGLVILARHFHWARRTLDWLKQKWEQAREKVQNPKRH